MTDKERINQLNCKVRKLRAFVQAWRKSAVIRGETIEKTYRLLRSVNLDASLLDRFEDIFAIYEIDSRNLE
jgi:hypothetical protein